jgi:hypothetical protein
MQVQQNLLLCLLFSVLGGLSSNASKAVVLLQSLISIWTTDSSCLSNSISNPQSCLYGRCLTVRTLVSTGPGMYLLNFSQMLRWGHSPNGANWEKHAGGRDNHVNKEMNEIKQEIVQDVMPYLPRFIWRR